MTLPDFSKSQYLPIIFIPGAFYYISPLRQWANSYHHKRINEQIRKGLVDIGGYADKPDQYTWNKLRSLFYSLIDEDKSLTKKAGLAYANGSIWTSFADTTSLSVVFLVPSSILYLCGSQRSIYAAVAFFFIGALSIYGSFISTRKHVDIGTQQIEIIRFKYSDTVKERLASLDF